MKKSEYLFKSFINAIGAFIYTAIIAWVLFNGQTFFGKTTSFLMPFLLLLLFIISALITGLTILGKPIQLYLSGFKKGAFILLSATLIWLTFFTIVVILILLLS